MKALALGIATVSLVGLFMACGEDETATGTSTTTTSGTTTSTTSSSQGGSTNATSNTTGQGAQGGAGQGGGQGGAGQGGGGDPCMSDPNDTMCISCVKMMCCPQLQACTADLECTACLTCLGGGDPGACFGGMNAPCDPQGDMETGALLQCGLGMCPNDCP